MNKQDKPVQNTDSKQTSPPIRGGWVCPINFKGCTSNCGNYGCGN